jgi:shikimate dehydrogenase
MNPTCYYLGLIGYPLGHSLSPQLHHAALAAAGLQGNYRLFAIPPTPEGQVEIGRLVEQLRQGKLQGLNVTIPHKQNVLPFLDRQSLVAQAVGAVNTLYTTSEGSGVRSVVGDNTDVPGFLWDLHRLAGAGTGQALVLGAGGSARAVVYALAQSGWQVQVVARRPEQASALVAEIGVASGLEDRLRAGAMEIRALAQYCGNCDLLVNTTPLGMVPNTAGCPWPEDLPLPERAAVYDLVYNPLETGLIKRAWRAGLVAASGAGMLVAQAALAFKKWTGLEPPFEVMERAFYGDAL